MTGGHDQLIRNKWEIGPGDDHKWDRKMRKRAKAVIWEFFRSDIISMYQGQGKYTQTAPNGIFSAVKKETGFELPISTMLNQFRDWGVCIVGRGGGCSVAKVVRQSKNPPSKIPIPRATSEITIDRPHQGTIPHNPPYLDHASSSNLEQCLFLNSNELPPTHHSQQNENQSSHLFGSDPSQASQSAFGPPAIDVENNVQQFEHYWNKVNKVQAYETQLLEQAHKFDNLKQKYLVLQDQKGKEEKINLLLRQHIRHHATELQSLTTTFSTHCLKDNVERILQSLNSPSIDGDRHTSKDSGFFSGGMTNSKHLSVCPQGMYPKRPRDIAMHSSMSADENPNAAAILSPPTVAKRPRTVPDNNATRSTAIDEYHAGFAAPFEATGTAPPQNFEDSSFLLYLNEDQTLMGVQGGDWNNASLPLAPSISLEDNGEFMGSRPADDLGALIYGSSR
ncbi:hypothetical protein BJ878DRAFT_43126 [Calycina marina]|uniref:Uncharacterized protein n=1 Tax=Calycina marina TaxID=1763456 RepID=A0A9P7Z4B6_9HELO|nr:hypothetical protein BJ878DRAFT_43126 [Calycina marina]